MKLPLYCLYLCVLAFSNCTIESSVNKVNSGHVLTRSVCDGLYAENFNIYKVGVVEPICRFSSLGEWHNTFLENIDMNSSSFASLDPELNSETYDTLEAIIERTYVYSSPQVQQYIPLTVSEPNSSLRVIGNMIETLQPISHDDVEEFTDLSKAQVDSLYNFQIINDHARKLLYQLLDDYANNDDVVDFERHYDSLATFYNQEELSSIISAAILSVSEYSFCYWSEYGPDEEVFPILVGLGVVDCTGAIINVWGNFAKRMITGDYDWDLNEALGEAVNGGIQASGMGLIRIKIKFN